ncbi:MAG: hypothetical protein KDA93_06615 [Planctomycetaceae bacterium]|nr:hypothetical protein [Planctomycetaceae bacterium]
MKTRSGGSFAALLMSGPLATIPLMAMFGVPQFSTVSAPTNNAPDDVIRRPTALSTATKQTSGLFDDSARANSSRIDEFDPLTESSPELSGVPHQTEPTGVIEDIHRIATINSKNTGASFSTTFHSEFDTAQSRETATTVPSQPQTRPSPTTLLTSPRAKTQTPTWENAAQKLREMGIDDYRLEHGLDGNTFVFICQFASGADSRIIRRFEAESAAPEEAVRGVLDQISNWRTTASIR